DTLDFPELRRIILADSRQVVMHQTLEDSVDALVGKLPPVAPAKETDDPQEAQEPVRPKIREELQEVIDSLQKALDQLKELAP
ncbi:MAG: hypothetical protein ACOC3Y_03975, partial [Desulfohalobiaceae bacterium]